MYVHILLLNYNYLLFCFVQFKELEKMKYRCIAFGFFEDDVQVVTTTDCSSCISPRCIEYIRAITVVGMYND